MRVALFTETFLPKIDGVVNTLCHLLHHLEARGHPSILFAPAGGLGGTLWRGPKGSPLLWVHPGAAESVFQKAGGAGGGPSKPPPTGSSPPSL